jgi:hypothetical protein
MLEARKASVWKNRYDIIADGQRLATWDESSWKASGTVELDGRQCARPLPCCLARLTCCSLGRLARGSRFGQEIGGRGDPRC